MNIQDGKSLETAIVINKSVGTDVSQEIDKILAKMFGVVKPPDDCETEEEMFWSYDGDYFVISQQTLDNPDKTKKYRVVYVDDMKGCTHTIFFEI